MLHHELEARVRTDFRSFEGIHNTRFPLYSRNVHPHGATRSQRQAPYANIKRVCTASIEPVYTRLCQ